MIKYRRDLHELEEKLNVKFKNIELLEVALTHSSYANQRKHIKFNERLEYLGDAVLGLIIAEYLFKQCKDKSEGELTKIRALIVCEGTLYAIADKLQIGNFMLMSKGEEITGGRNRVSILADCMEAIIAAIYFDQGFEVARNFVLENFNDHINKAIQNELIMDYKTKLQELVQKQNGGDIEYKVMSLAGPPHRPTFKMEVFIGDKIYGSGEGGSKKEAEQSAAKEALSKLNSANTTVRDEKDNNE